VIYSGEISIVLALAEKHERVEKPENPKH